MEPTSLLRDLSGLFSPANYQVHSTWPHHNQPPTLHSPVLSSVSMSLQSSLLTVEAPCAKLDLQLFLRTGEM